MIRSSPRRLETALGVLERCSSVRVPRVAVEGIVPTRFHYRRECGSHAQFNAVSRPDGGLRATTLPDSTVFNHDNATVYEPMRILGDCHGGAGSWMRRFLERTHQPVRDDRRIGLQLHWSSLGG